MEDTFFQVSTAQIIDNPKKKTKAQIQKEKDDYERLLWERAEEYEDYDG